MIDPTIEAIIVGVVVIVIVVCATVISVKSPRWKE